MNRSFVAALGSQATRARKPRGPAWVRPAQRGKGGFRFFLLALPSFLGSTGMTQLTWYRSWPTEIPEGRAYVHDSMDRLPMSNCDYRTVPFWPYDEPGICMLEWDVALALPERVRFAELALLHPDRVLVAPYSKPYDAGPGRWVHRWVHRLVDQTPIEQGQDWCHYFGFGCIYLPREMVVEFTEFYLRPDRPKRQFTDVTFSLWHLKQYGHADVTWDVRPAHLHGD